MAFRQEEAVAEIIQESGALEGQVPRFPGRDSNTQAQTDASVCWEDPTKHPAILEEQT